MNWLAMIRPVSSSIPHVAVKSMKPTLREPGIHLPSGAPGVLVPATDA